MQQFGAPVQAHLSSLPLFLLLLIDLQHHSSFSKLAGVYPWKAQSLHPKTTSCRNVTVSGAKGTDTVLDQQFQRARLQLCGNCTWTYQNITVANDSRGSGAGNELFVAAELGARLVLQDAHVLRLACPSPADTLGVLTITPRSAAFKDGQTQQQHSTRDISIQVWGMLQLAGLFWAHTHTPVEYLQRASGSIAHSLGPFRTPHCIPNEDRSMFKNRHVATVGREATFHAALNAAWRASPLGSAVLWQQAAPTAWLAMRSSAARSRAVQTETKAAGPAQQQ